MSRKTTRKENGVKTTRTMYIEKLKRDTRSCGLELKEQKVEVGNLTQYKDNASHLLESSNVRVDKQIHWVLGTVSGSLWTITKPVSHRPTI